MKDKLVYLISAAFVSILSSFLLSPICVEASDGEEYITIAVDALDDNSGLMYALDTDDPGAFTSNNEFRVLAGTSHTIYVKDSAGNITSQTYDVADTKEPQNTTVVGSTSDDNKKSKYYEYLTDSAPAENGEGTVYDKMVTDGSSEAEKVFYTITTAEGDVFYLVLDQGQGADNVYLLNQVTNTELQSLAVDDKGIKEEKANEANLLQALQDESELETTELEDKNKKDAGTLTPLILLAVVGAGGFYYFKVYRKKKTVEMDLSDARDLDDFEAEDDDDDEIVFDDEYTDEEKEEFLNNLVEEDDDYFDDSEELEEAEVEESIIEESPEEATFFGEEIEYDPELDGEEE